MTSPASLTIVIPAYNEEASLQQFLPDVIAYCQQNGCQLIVVNDASTDKTAEVLSDFSKLHGEVLTVLTHKVNRGYGGALITGLSQVETAYAVTMDADGQHRLEDIQTLLQQRGQTDADLVIGSRSSASRTASQAYRSLGKSLIRSVAKMMMDVPVKDLNSGMKLYTVALVKKYLPLCPESMAFSEVMTLIFIQKKHLVIEAPIEVRERTAGKSTINTMTALDTIIQIINMIMLFNPLRIFLPVGSLLILLGAIWALPFLISGSGLSTAALLFITTGLILILLGLIAEQLAQLRKKDF